MTATTAEIPAAMTQQSRLLLAAHTAMRADTRRLFGAVGRLAGADPQEAERLGRAFSELVRLIHDHHWAEDDVIYPFLIERVPGFDVDAVALEHDHVELDAVMTRISARLRQLAHRRSERLRLDAQARLTDDAGKFSDVMLDHLDREEALVVPAFDTVIAAADQRVLEKEESKLATYRHLRMAVPWVLANATPLEAVELRRTAPRLIGLFHDHAWERHFLHVMAPLYRTD